MAPFLKVPLLFIDAIAMRVTGTPPNGALPREEHVVPDWRERFLKSLAWPCVLLRVKSSIQYEDPSSQLLLGHHLESRNHRGASHHLDTLSLSPMLESHSFCLHISFTRSAGHSNHPGIPARKYSNDGWCCLAPPVLSYAWATVHVRAQHTEAPLLGVRRPVRICSPSELHRNDPDHYRRTM